MNYYLDVWRKYAVFQGRARGREFWYFALINFIVTCILEIVGTMLSGGNQYSSLTNGLTGIYTLAILLPAIGVTIRRLHDTDRSGWFILLAFVPVVGQLVLLVLCALPGTIGSNKYGLDPTDVAGIAAAV